MRMYRATASTEVRVDYGIELCEGLDAFPETAVLRPPLQQVNDALDAAHQKRRTLERALVRQRAVLRRGEYKLEVLLRTVSRSLEILEGGRRGPLHEALIPGGVTVLLAPTGQRQLAAARDVLGRLQRNRLPAAEPARQQWLEPLTAGLAAFAAVVEAHEQARTAMLAAFQEELALRQDHQLTVDKLIGLVRAAFPRDRARQELIFPRTDGGRTAAAEEDDAPADGPVPDDGAGPVLDSPN